MHTLRQVALGIAVVLRELERIFKRHAIVYHAGENKIRRAVENAREFVYLVCGEALAYRSDYRYSAADRRFKEEVHIVLCGVSEQLAALRRDKLFVRGHKLRLRALAHDAVVIFVDYFGNAASDNAVAHYRYIHDNCLPTVIDFYYFITNSPGDKDPKENFLTFL